MNVDNIYHRRLTREVRIGDLPLGGTNPIRVQSMTNTPTLDTAATVAQAIRMIHAGSEYVRITARNLAEAGNLGEIKKALRSQGYHTPLIADIHFNPSLAMEAARRVEKIRINPGNFLDRKYNAPSAFTDKEYEEELEKIAGRLLPLLAVCREYGTALRIGTNHGSLSGRILGRYGDTPEGMAASAMEFVRICHGEGYHRLVLSMKSSNTRVTVRATRLLVSRMQQEGFNYPVHLGVTEAGDGEDGRTISAVGIGTLLEEGIGDTIRVSLTGPPEQELPVARLIASRYNDRNGPYADGLQTPVPADRGDFRRGLTVRAGRTGGGKPPVVVTTCLGRAALECHYFNPAVQRPDLIYDPPGRNKLPHPAETGILRHFPETGKEAATLLEFDPDSFPGLEGLEHPWIQVAPEDWTGQTAQRLAGFSGSVIVLYKPPETEVLAARRFIGLLGKAGCPLPVVLRFSYAGCGIDQFHLFSAIEAGSLLTDGLADGLWLEWNPEATCKFTTMAAFNILQATGERLTRTRFIACPSCGRTEFDIQRVLSEVREQTGHLHGLKIAVMGCVVNGPGEMADADYGYVGAGKGKVTLYKGKNPVKRNIPEKEALDALVKLIRDSGDWQPQ